MKEKKTRNAVFTSCNCVMTWWNPILQDILSIPLTPCTINLIQAWSINPRWLCCAQDNSTEYFHILRTQEQRETGKLVLLYYYVDACAFCSIDRIQQLRCVYVCRGRSQLLKPKENKATSKYPCFCFLKSVCLVFPHKKRWHFNVCRMYVQCSQSCCVFGAVILWGETFW